MSTIPPKKPHFFTFVSPDSQNGARIPISFICKYLNEEKCECALLRRGCKKWAVKIDGRLFADGWERFERDNGLELGDFIVFRHEGHMVFEALVFDPSLCEREFSQSSSDTDHHDAEKVDISGEKKISYVEPKASKKPIHRHEGSKKFKKKKMMENGDAKAKSSLLGSPRSFSAILTPYSIKKSVLSIPTKFARLNGLSNRACEMILRDEKLKSWPVRLRKKKPYNQAVVGRGWRDFCYGNGLKQGDKFVLELIKKGETPIMKFRRLRKKPTNATIKSVLKPPERMTSAFGCDRHFVSTLKEYSIKKSTLYLPKDFATKNGLTNCEMILRNENRASWLVELRDTGEYVYIARGWHAFRIANNLKKGDGFKFELVENGKKPLVNFSRMKPKKYA